MALLTHNFSKLPPPFPAAHGLAMQGSGTHSHSPQLHFHGQHAVPAAPLPSLNLDQLLAFRD